MPIIGLILGAIVGVLIHDRFESAVAGGFIGLIAGLVFNQWRKRGAPATPAVAPATSGEPNVRLDAIERRLAQLEAAFERAGLAMPAPATVAPAPPARAPAPAVMPLAPPLEPELPATRADGSLAAETIAP